MAHFVRTVFAVGSYDAVTTIPVDVAGSGVDATVNVRKIQVANYRVLVAAYGV